MGLCLCMLKCTLKNKSLKSQFNLETGFNQFFYIFLELENGAEFVPLDMLLQQSVGNCFSNTFCYATDSGWVIRSLVFLCANRSFFTKKANCSFHSLTYVSAGNSLIGFLSKLLVFAQK